jgi:Uma2 family endonuclease
LLLGVNWQTYEKMLEAIGDRPVRVTYDRGNLELMSPTPTHEIYKRWFNVLFVMLAEELPLRVKACGSTTFRRQDLDRGLEPDECFYLTSVERVREWAALDLSQDPPPDLAIEVDITRSCLDRMGVYAGLGVPELWRFDGESLQPYRLREDRTYESCAQSPALPFLPLPEFVPFLHQSLTAADDRDLLRSLRAWVRQRVLPSWEAHTSTRHSPGESG